MQRRIMSLIIIILVLAIFSFLNSSYFVTEELEWEGVKYLDISQLAARTSFASQNVFRIDQTTLLKDIKEHLWVKSAKLQWGWPNRLIVKIKERKPIAMVPIGDNWFLCDDEGVLLPFPPGFPADTLPIITNADLDEGASFETITRLLANIPPSLSEYISEWNAKEQILITRKGTQILFGDLRHMTAKFKTLELILADLADRNMIVKKIDLRVLNSPVIVE